MPCALEYAVAAITDILDQKIETFQNNGFESYKDMLVIDSILQSTKINGVIVNVPES